MSARTLPNVKKTNLANAVRSKRPPEVITELRRDLAEANIAKAVEKALSVAPPLRDEQVERLAHLLRGGAA